MKMPTLLVGVFGNITPDPMTRGSRVGFLPIGCISIIGQTRLENREEKRVGKKPIEKYH